MTGEMPVFYPRQKAIALVQSTPGRSISSKRCQRMIHAQRHEHLELVRLTYNLERSRERICSEADIEVKLGP